MVRLGIYEPQTRADEIHRDVRVAHYEAHEAYDKKLGTNDIAIVHL